MTLQVTPYAPPLAAAGVAFVVTAVRVARRTDSEDGGARSEFDA